MTTMLERIARVIDPVGWDWYDHSDHRVTARGVFREASLRKASLVVAALELPTDAMQAAGRDKLGEWLPDGRLAKPAAHQWQPANEVWLAMAKAASCEG